MSLSSGQQLVVQLLLPAHDTLSHIWIFCAAFKRMAHLHPFAMMCHDVLCMLHPHGKNSCANIRSPLPKLPSQHTLLHSLHAQMLPCLSPSPGGPQRSCNIARLVVM